MTRYRGKLIWLGVFVTVCLTLIWTVFVTLQRNVGGETKPYAAVFSDVSGLKIGDEVRMAGVTVGRVDNIALEGTRAKVDFRVDAGQVLYGNTKAAIVYQNIIGQRYLGLSLADFGSPKVLAAGAVIPVERTEPSFDISKLLNGFEPLFALLDPEQVDNLTTALVRGLQGDSAALTTLISDTTRLAESYSGTDELLDGVLNNLNQVLDSVADRRGDVDGKVSATFAAPLFPKYVLLVREPLARLEVRGTFPSGAVLFLCSHNSARSQLAAALWMARTHRPAESAGTHPAPRVHRGALAAARRAGLSLGDAVPRLVGEIPDGTQVVTVCDRAHEELDPDPSWWHWSIPDPVETGRPAAFDNALADLDTRIASLISHSSPI